MRILKNITLLVLVFTLASCSKAVIFPVSVVTPAAEMEAKTKTDKNNNHVITVKGKYLAAPDRLTPPKKTYVVWIVTDNNGILNIGQLRSKTPAKAELKTVSSFKPVEIFITAEEAGDVKAPAGTEITRRKM